MLSLKMILFYYKMILTIKQGSLIKYHSGVHGAFETLKWGATLFDSC